MAEATPAAADFFAQQAQRWDGLYRRKWAFRDRLALFVSAVQQYAPPGAEVLDVGCGSGNIALALAQRGYQVRGVDGAETMLQVAREQARQRGLSGLVFERQDLTALDAPQAAFDVVICSSVIEYIPDDAAFARRMVAALRPGGTLLISAPHSASMLGRVEDMGRGLRSWRRSAARGHLHFSLRRYATAELERMLAGAGASPIARTFFEAPRLGRLGVALSRWSALGVMVLVAARKAAAPDALREGRA